MNPIRIFANPEHVKPGYDGLLNPIIRYLWQNSEPKGHQIETLSQFFNFDPDPAIAEIYMLPYAWNFYLEENQINLVKEELEKAKKLRKKLVVFSFGDFTANIPFEDVFIFESCGYRSRRKQRNQEIFGYPVIIEDYLNRYANNLLNLRSKTEVPVVGFCGQADGTWLDFTLRGIRHYIRWLLFLTGFRKWEPPPFETTRFRKKILDRIKLNPNIESNFVLRRKYRAGYWAPKKDPFHITRMEFVNNILSSDYTVCMRGGGNFSVRFYETLSLGRIPIFVDTDCVLPFDDEIDYRKHFIWVEENEIPSIDKKILNFHSTLSPSEFQQLQVECRNLWIRYFSWEGFYSNLYRYLRMHPEKIEY